MPLMKYVFFGGSALVLLLLAMNWLLPDPTAEAVYSSTKRPVIRISSIQTLPERVVFDTSMSAPPPSVVRVAAQPRQSALCRRRYNLPTCGKSQPNLPTAITASVRLLALSALRMAVM